METLKREDYIQIIEKFTEGFNKDNLDNVMNYFTEDAVYVEYNGKKHVGKVAIKKAFTPQFKGVLGDICFQPKEFIVDTTQSKVHFSWHSTIEINGKILDWEGLDVFHFQGELIKEKRTYTQADIPLFALKQKLLLPYFLTNIGLRTIKQRLNRMN